MSVCHSIVSTYLSLDKGVMIGRFTFAAPVKAAIAKPKLGLKINDRPAKYPAGSAYNAESQP